MSFLLLGAVSVFSYVFCLYNLGYGVFGIAEIYLTILCSGDIYWILHCLGEGGHREWGYVSGAHACECDMPCVEPDLPTDEGGGIQPA